MTAAPELVFAIKLYGSLEIWSKGQQELEVMTEDQLKNQTPVGEAFQ